MPTYDYECDACGHEFELFQGINDAVKRKCPDCGKQKLRRLFGTGGAVVFKGSGFYETDYRSDSYKKGAKAAEESKKAESNGDAKSGSKEKADSKSASGKPGKADTKKSSKKPSSD